MTRRYILALEAALNLVQIWRHINQRASREMADRVESVIRDKIVFLAQTPGAGHSRKDLTDEPVKFFSVYSYLIATSPRPSHCRSSRFSTDTVTSRWFSEVAYNVRIEVVPAL